MALMRSPGHPRPNPNGRSSLLALAEPSAASHGGTCCAERGGPRRTSGGSRRGARCPHRYRGQSTPPVPRESNREREKIKKNKIPSFMRPGDLATSRPRGQMSRHRFEGRQGSRPAIVTSEFTPGQSPDTPSAPAPSLHAFR